MSYYPRRAGEPSVEPVTLAEALEHLHQDAGVEDSYIQGLITAARIACENRIERSLISTPWEVTMDAFPDAIVLAMPPVISVTSVKFIDQDGIEQTLDPNDYIVDTKSEPGYIVPAVGKAWPDTQDRINAVTVAYLAGYGTTADKVPGPIKHWIKLAIGDMRANRNRSGDKPAVPHDFADGLLDYYKIMRF